MRVCKRCQIEKPFSEFTARFNSTSGYMFYEPRCKECMPKYRREVRLAKKLGIYNPEPRLGPPKNDAAKALADLGRLEIRKQKNGRHGIFVRGTSLRVAQFENKEAVLGVVRTLTLVVDKQYRRARAIERKLAKLEAEAAATGAVPSADL